jgi:uncharacterized protein YbaR (Trm112 family)
MKPAIKKIRGEKMPDIDPKLLEILVCPLTKGSLEYDRSAQELISRSAQLAYPVRNGIPVMLIEEARPLSTNDAVKP